MSKEKHWIDNADSWICPVCGFECHSPSDYEGCKCPKCGFQDEKDKQIEEMAKVIAIPCRTRIEAYGDGSKECPSPLPCNECTAELIYKAGYRKQSEWISVDDRLPEEDVRVLVYLDSQHRYTKIDTDRLYKGEWVRWCGGVTHWMPLPSTPEKEKNND